MDAWRWYARFTEDMPGAVASNLDAHQRAIEAAYALLQAEIAAVGTKRTSRAGGRRAGARGPAKKRRG